MAENFFSDLTSWYWIHLLKLNKIQNKSFTLSGLVLGIFPSDNLPNVQFPKRQING